MLTQGDKLNLIKAQRKQHTQSLRPVAVENLKTAGTTHSRVRSVPAAIKVRRPEPNNGLRVQIREKGFVR